MTRVHRVVGRDIGQRAPGAGDGDEARVAQLGQMKRQRWRGQVEAVAQVRGREAGGARLNQGAEDAQAGFLGEGFESRDDLC